jgi:hypothetical protein
MKKVETKLQSTISYAMEFLLPESLHCTGIPVLKTKTILVYL